MPFRRPPESKTFGALLPIDHLKIKYTGEALLNSYTDNAALYRYLDESEHSDTPNPRDQSHSGWTGLSMLMAAVLCLSGVGLVQAQAPKPVPKAASPVQSADPMSKGQPVMKVTSYSANVKEVTVTGGAVPGGTASLRMVIETSGSGTMDIPWSFTDGKSIIASGTERGLAAGKTVEVKASYRVPATVAAISYQGQIDIQNAELKKIEVVVSKLEAKIKDSEEKKAKQKEEAKQPAAADQTASSVNYARKSNGALVTAVPNGAGTPSARLGLIGVVATAGSGGSISPAATSFVMKGSVLTFTVTPSAGSAVDRVTGCGGALVESQGRSGPRTYITGPVNAECTVSAEFKLDLGASSSASGS
jgi:hypothetical protein